MNNTTEYLKLVEFCGEDAANSLLHRLDIDKQIFALKKEQEALEEELKKSFSVNLSWADIIVAISAGVLCGVMNGLFKSYVPKHGNLKHKHSTTRTGVDYKVPKPKGMKGSVQGLHRQIGPGHDIGRFKEALDLMSGKTKDFPLWGKTIAEQTGDVLHAGNMSIEDFLAQGGFKIPADPKAELMNHLLIDFFTKTSLPLPFSSYIADNSQAMAKIMMGMYDNGLNLKNVVGNVSSLAILQLVTHSYAYLFKSAKEVNLYSRIKDVSSPKEFMTLFNELGEENKRYIKSKDFNVLQALAHGSSFLVDTIITVGSKNYAGLFCLDFGTLIAFATVVIKYVKQSTDTYKDTLSEINVISDQVLSLENSWYEAFREDMLRLAEKENFFDTFDPEKIMASHNEIIGKLEQGQYRTKEMLSELNDWDV